MRRGFVAKASLIVLVCLLDLVLNGLADNRPVLTSQKQNLPLVWVGVQFGLQLLNAILLFMLFFGTYLFQVGLIGVLLREFRGVLAALAAYAVLFAAYAAVKLVRGGGAGCGEGRGGLAGLLGGLRQWLWQRARAVADVPATRAATPNAV